MRFTLHAAICSARRTKVKRPNAWPDTAPRLHAPTLAPFGLPFTLTEPTNRPNHAKTAHV